MKRFQDKVAVVTGGSSGIGAAITAGLAAEGAIVHVVASSNLAKAQAVVSGMQLPAGRAVAMVADVRDAAAMRALADSVVAEHGRIDIWVNAAGLFLASPPGETEVSVLDSMIDTNLKGTWNGIQAVVPHMKAAGSGKVLNFSSVAGLTAFKGFALYSASKAAIVMMTRVLGAELAPFGINVNAIAPGNTATPMNEGIRKDPAHAGVLDAMQAMTPSTTVFTPAEEIAGIALFLLSPEARSMHGSVLLADEGISAAIG
jgi:3-oxoacyl-[acyl-carrier protein] reductase